jgi:hypothetical protein
MRLTHLALLVCLTTACTGNIVRGGDDQGDDDPDAPDAGPLAPSADPFVGADGRDLTQYLPHTAAAGVERRQALGYGQMRKELQRVTGRDWTGDYGQVAGTLGAADADEQRHVDDAYPTSAKLRTWMDITGDVCAAWIDRERDAPDLFTTWSPTQDIDTGAAGFAQQLRRFLERAVLSPALADDMLPEALTFMAAAAPGQQPSQVWVAMCQATLLDPAVSTY